MCELTVAMPARNTGKYIRQAIESVLVQENVDFELIVVDDASDDDTAAIVGSLDDERIRLFRNETRRGIGFCHNLILRESRAPFIVHVDSDDLVFKRHAFHTMLETIREDPGVGQVHCYAYTVDEQGRVTRDEFLRRRSQQLWREVGMDYKRQLLVFGSVMNFMRMYRKAVFRDVGPFDEELEFGVDLHMALKVIDQFEIRLVPEFFFVVREHRARTSQQGRFLALRSWRLRRRIVNRLVRDGQVRFPRSREYAKNRLLLIGLLCLLRVPKAFRWVKDRPAALYRSTRRGLQRACDSLGERMYRLCVEHLAWWPLGPRVHPVPRLLESGGKVAYHLWQFPALSETFVRREIQALEGSGLSVVVVAEGADESYRQEEADPAPTAVRYLRSSQSPRCHETRRHFLVRHPFRTLNAFLYTILHRHSALKTLREDRSVFQRAVILAGILRDEGVVHLHAPWADRSAFVALLASRILGIPFSVQVRAHDLHRKRHAYALREKFEHAEFVISNTDYNRNHVQSLLRPRSAVRIRRVYEGIDVSSFSAAQRTAEQPREFKLLSVARLIEEKGLLWLLRACRILKESRRPFRCEIVGGAEEPAFRDYHVLLKRLHRELGLSDCVSFAGAQPFSRVLERYEAADIFVLPCVVAGHGGRDISPNSMIEAMAMKLPVVSTNISALPELVDHERNGILVEPGDEHALAAAIARLMDDPHLRVRLGENARRKVEERFDLSKNVAEISQLFRGRA